MVKMQVKLLWKLKKNRGEGRVGGQGGCGQRSEVFVKIQKKTFSGGGGGSGGGRRVGGGQGHTGKC